MPPVFFASKFLPQELINHFRCVPKINVADPADEVPKTSVVPKSEFDESFISDTCTGGSPSKNHDTKAGPQDSDITERPKRIRTAFSPKELGLLEREFQRDNYLTRSKRRLISKILKRSEQTIKIWYQNRRMKRKRNNLLYLAKQANEYPIACPPNHSQTENYMNHSAPWLPQYYHAYSLQTPNDTYSSNLNTQTAYPYTFYTIPPYAVPAEATYQDVFQYSHPFPEVTQMINYGPQSYATGISQSNTQQTACCCTMCNTSSEQYDTYSSYPSTQTDPLEVPSMDLQNLEQSSNVSDSEKKSSSSSQNKFFRPFEDE